jgi:hypothetical protein
VSDEDPKGTPNSRVALANARAELLFLDGRDEQALRELEQIDPDLSQVDTPIRLAALDNRLLLEGQLWALTNDEFYLQQDRRRLAGFHFQNERRVLDANEALTQGKHSESHRLYWAELWDAYHSGSWRATREAASSYGRECLALGWFHRAAFYAAVSLNKDLAEAVGKSLVTAGNRKAVESTVSMALAVGELCRWRQILCKLLLAMEDAIPDQSVSTVLASLLRVRQPRGASQPQEKADEAVWGVIERLSVRRLTASGAEAIAERGLSHPALRVGGSLRQSVVLSMAQCASILSVEAREQVAVAIAEAATATRHDLDYDAAVWALGHVAGCGNEALRSRLRSILFGAGIKDTNHVLLMHASDFGVKLNPDYLNAYAKQVAGFVSMQVQRLSPDEQATKIPGFGAIESVSADKRLAVVMLGGVYNLKVVVAHRATISSEGLAAVMDALLSAAEDPDNIPVNRSALIEVAGLLADALDEPRKVSIFGRLLPFAMGNALTNGSFLANEGMKDPLSRFQFDFGDDLEIRSEALMACARLTAGLEGRLLDGVVSAIRIALTDVEARVRRGALIAAGLLKDPPAVLLPGLLLLTRDGQPGVAEAGLWALSRIDPARLDGPAWELVRFAVEMASCSLETAVRGRAALVAKTLSAGAPMGAREALEGLRQRLLTDVSFNVREAAAGDHTPANGAAS